MIAKTILEQIGGRRFAAMTGSKDFTDMGNGLRMSLARNKTSANRLDIIYDGGADLYNMRFYRKTFSKKTFESRTKDIETHEGIYCDMLEHKHKDGFQEPYGQEFSRSGIYRLYPAYRNRQHGIFTRYHRALQGR